MNQAPRGTQDLYALQVRKWQMVEDMIRQLCFVYGYGEIRTPIFEHTEVFQKENDTSDMVTKEMYSFEKGDRSITLRPEGTAGVIRSFVEKKMYGNAELPVKLYYQGPMFRYERPQKGRYRQFHQFGVEAIGTKSAVLDAEVIALGCSIVSAVGISETKVLINTLGDEESRAAYRAALKEHFQPHLETLCGDCKRRYEMNPLRLLDCKVDKEQDCMKQAPLMKDYLNDESKAYFEEVLQALDTLGIVYEIDNRLVRGLDYYTHTVFEVVSTHPSAGAQATVFAGGRYDGLVADLGGPDMSGVGFGMGMERLIAYAEEEGNVLAEEDGVDCYVMPLSKSCQAEALRICSELRANGYQTAMDYAGRSMKAQFKSVERLQAKVVLFLGEDELREQVVQVKDIATQNQMTVPFEAIVPALDLLVQASEEHYHVHGDDCGDDCDCGHDHDHEHEHGHDCNCGHHHHH